MSVSINGPGGPDLLTLKLVCESQLRRGTFLLHLRTLGLWVLELFDMYTTDGQTDGRADGQKQRLLPLCPLPYGRGHNNNSGSRGIVTSYLTHVPVKLVCSWVDNRLYLRSLDVRRG